MKALLDTHTLLWALQAPEFLSDKAKTAIAGKTNRIFVSAASAWEIATKVRLGKIPEAEELERELMEAVDDAGYELLSIDAACALRAGRLAGEHRDPFDRIIAAQALTEDMPVVSKDLKLDTFGIRRIW